MALPVCGIPCCTPRDLGGGPSQSYKPQRVSSLGSWTPLTLLFPTAAFDGDFWRLLNPGEYEVTAAAEGYHPVTQNCRVSFEDHPTICNFRLTKTPKQRLREILAKGGKVPKDLILRLRQLRLRKLKSQKRA